MTALWPRRAVHTAAGTAAFGLSEIAAAIGYSCSCDAAALRVSRWHLRRTDPCGYRLQLCRSYSSASADDQDHDHV